MPAGCIYLCGSRADDTRRGGDIDVYLQAISDKSNRDKTLLMEKLGVIKSAEAFGTAAMLRDKFSHNDPEESALRIERLNLIVDEANFVDASFDEVNSYLHRKVPYQTFAASLLHKFVSGHL